MVEMRLDTLSTAASLPAPAVEGGKRDRVFAFSALFHVYTALVQRSTHIWSSVYSLPRKRLLNRFSVSFPC